MQAFQVRTEGFEPSPYWSKGYRPPQNVRLVSRRTESLTRRWNASDSPFARPPDLAVRNCPLGARTRGNTDSAHSRY